MKEKGLSLVALNGMDSKEVIQKYIEENKFTFSIGMAERPGDPNYAVAKQYGVQAYPTNYLIDSNGKVVWRAVGFDEQGLRKALEKMALK